MPVPPASPTSLAALVANSMPCRLSAAFSGLGRYIKPIECYNKAIELDAKIDEVWYHKGEALNALGRATEAEAAFAKANELVQPG